MSRDYSVHIAKRLTPQSSSVPKAISKAEVDTAAEELPRVKARAPSTTMSEAQFAEIYDVDAEDEEVVAIDAFEYKDTITSSKLSSFGTERCGGYTLVLPNGKSALGKYPFLQYKADMPWEVRIRKGMVFVLSEKCTGIAGDSSAPCIPCQSLKHSRTLEQINERMSDRKSVV